MEKMPSDLLNKKAKATHSNTGESRTRPAEPSESGKSSDIYKIISTV